MMKSYIPLIVIAILAAFATGRTSYFLFQEEKADSDDIFLIERFKQEFEETTRPHSVINFQALIDGPHQRELFDPDSILIGGEDGGSSSYSTSLGCRSNLTVDLKKLPFEKVLLWEEFRCYRLVQLPSRFFSSPPYMHPSGHSYAWLAWKMKGHIFNEKNWALEHKQFFHIHELKFLKKEYGGLGKLYNLLSELDSDNLISINKGESSVLTEKNYFSKISYPDIFSMVEYKIYPRGEFENFLKKGPLRVGIRRPNSKCLYQDGQICWNYNLGYLLKETNRRTLFTIFFLCFMIGAIITVLVVKIKNQKKEEERKKLALQVLTHEFRTPVAALLVYVERLSKRLHFFDEDMQDIILRMSGQAYRLQRLTEKSRHYLHLQNSKKLINLQNEEIPSINQFVEDFVTGHENFEEIQYVPLEKDVSFVTDVFWLGICLKNLVGNAFAHGRPPVTLSLSQRSSGSIEFSVSDSGECPFNSLSEMTQEFVKGGQSQGSGLGLNIVQKVVKSMGGRFEFSLKPTTFKIILGGKKNVQNHSH